jgi:hypothetical protein
VLQNFVSFAFTLSFGGVPVEEELDARNVFRDCFPLGRGELEQVWIVGVFTSQVEGIGH